MVLTVFAIDKAKPGEKPFLLTDGNGLHLLVNPNGSKLWRFRYRFSGKQNLLSFGAYPEVGLAAARDRRDDARRLVAAGTDPSQKRKDDKQAATTAAGNSFRAVAEDYLAKLKEEGKAEATLSKNTWLLLDLASPLAERPITAIKPAEILDLLKKVEKTGRRETAHRLRGVIGSMYRYAIANLKAETDPTYPLRGALLKKDVQHRAAITDEVKLGALWRKIAAYDASLAVRACLQLTALTMCRPGEVRGMRRGEIVWLKERWEIPGTRTKMRKPHDVPLSRQALAVLREVWDLYPGSDYVLPSSRSVKKPLSENTMNKALRRMGYAQHEHTAHGFRSSASTVLNERGYKADVIEAALAHQEQDESRKPYNRALYWPERVKLLQDWADLLDQFKEQAVERAA
jgi:integrase